MVTTAVPNETAKGKVHDVDAATVRSWLESGQAVLVDVREVDEYLNERIEGATLRPLSTFDPSAVPLPNGQRIVLQCRTGDRSRRAALRLLADGQNEAYHLAGGIMAWKGAGFATVRTHVPITIARQVQITVGVLILTSLALAVFVSPWWLAATAFFGCGLTFAGVADKCPMAALIALMPWNRAFRSNQPCETSGGCSCAGDSVGPKQ